MAEIILLDSVFVWIAKEAALCFVAISRSDKDFSLGLKIYFANFGKFWQILADFGFWRIYEIYQNLGFALECQAKQSKAAKGRFK